MLHPALLSLEKKQARIFLHRSKSGKKKDMRMGEFGYGGMTWIGIILGLVITVVVIVSLVLLAVWAFRQTSRNSAQPGL